MIRILYVTKTQQVVGIQYLTWSEAFIRTFFVWFNFLRFTLLFVRTMCLSTTCDWGLYLFISTVSVLHKRNARFHVITIMKYPYMQKIKSQTKKESKTYLSQSCQPIVSANLVRPFKLLRLCDMFCYTFCAQNAMSTLHLPVRYYWSVVFNDDCYYIVLRTISHRRIYSHLSFSICLHACARVLVCVCIYSSLTQNWPWRREKKATTFRFDHIRVLFFTSFSFDMYTLLQLFRMITLA